MRDPAPSVEESLAYIGDRLAALVQVLCDHKSRIVLDSRRTEDGNAYVVTTLCKFCNREREELQPGPTLEWTQDERGDWSSRVGPP